MYKETEGKSRQIRKESLKTIRFKLKSNRQKDNRLSLPWSTICRKILHAVGVASTHGQDTNSFHKLVILYR